MSKTAPSSLALILTIVLVGLNLRPFMTGPGPVIDNIIQTTGMSYQSISLLTLLPMLLMGVGALVVPMLNQRIGERAGISTAMLLLLVGSLARYFVVDGAALLLTAFYVVWGRLIFSRYFLGSLKRISPKKWR